MREKLNLCSDNVKNDKKERTERVEDGYVKKKK